LAEEQTVSIAMDIDAKEVVYVTEVGHGELSVERGDGRRE
jgi:hypothetical protein